MRGFWVFVVGFGLGFWHLMSGETQAATPFAMPTSISCLGGNFIPGVSDLTTLQAARRNFIQARSELFQAMAAHLAEQKAVLGDKAALRNFKGQWSGRLLQGYQGSLTLFDSSARQCDFSGNMKAESAIADVYKLVSLLRNNAAGGDASAIGEQQDNHNGTNHSEGLPLVTPLPRSRSNNALLGQNGQNNDFLKTYYQKQCQDKYGRRFIRTSFKNNQYICHYRMTRKKRLKDAQKRCRKKYGKRLSRVSLSKKGSICYYRRSLKLRRRTARRLCRKKWGKRYVRTTMRRNSYVCHYRTYRRVKGRKAAYRACRRRYGRRFIRLKRRRGSYYCIFRRRR